MKAGPVKALFQQHESGKLEIKVVMVVPKRNFKLAHDRNRIKRQMREVWRLKKEKLHHALDSQTFTLHLGLLYISKSLPEYVELEKRIDSIINQLAIHVKPNTGTSANLAD